MQSREGIQCTFCPQCTRILNTSTQYRSPGTGDTVVYRYCTGPAYELKSPIPYTPLADRSGVLLPPHLLRRALGEDNTAYQPTALFSGWEFVTVFFNRKSMFIRVSGQHVFELGQHQTYRIYRYDYGARRPGAPGLAGTCVSVYRFVCLIFRSRASCPTLQTSRLPTGPLLQTHADSTPKPEKKFTYTIGGRRSRSRGTYAPTYVGARDDRCR